MTSAPVTRNRRRRFAFALLATAAAFLAVVVALGRPVPGWVDRAALSVAVRRIPVVDVDGRLLAAPSGAVIRILVVGDDHRVKQRLWRPMTGSRADSVSIWSVSSRATTVLTLSRDLRVHVPGLGDQKLSGVLDYGATALVRAVHDLTGLSVSHYVDVRFDAFTQVIDGLGGIRLVLRHAVRDATIGLYLPAGREHLDGATALRYVRSRHPVQRVGGTWVAEAPGDAGRIVRQHRVLAAVLSAMRAHSLTWLAGHASMLLDGGGLVVDRQFDADALIALLHSRDVARGRLAQVCTLPTAWQVPDAVAVSPFGPAHNGSENFRIPVKGSAAMLRWINADGAGGPAPRGCGPMSANAGAGASP